MPSIWTKIGDCLGKYLVLRRDGTKPPWPHFILGGDDPASPAGLRGYAQKSEELGYDAEYVESIRQTADEWEQRPPNPKCDPPAPKHRIDSPFILAMMRGECDLAGMTNPDGSFDAKVIGEYFRSKYANLMASGKPMILESSTMTIRIPDFMYIVRGETSDEEIGSKWDVATFSSRDRADAYCTGLNGHLVRLLLHVKNYDHDRYSHLDEMDRATEKMKPFDPEFRHVGGCEYSVIEVPFGG